MEVNITEVAAAAVAMFIVSGFWFMVPFGNLWGKIHGFDRLSKAEQEKAQKAMGPYYLVTVLTTFMTAFVLSHFIGALSDVQFYQVAFWVWLGFMLPTTASDMIFGGAPEGYVWHKIAITASGSLVATLVGSWVISLP